jgi:hypothetical protein
MSSELDRIRAQLSALIAEIEQGHRALAPLDVRDPGDREAYDIICRIERKLQQQKVVAA